MLQDPNQYFFAAILLVISVAMAVLMTLLPQILTRVFRLQKANPVKLQSYECGITPSGPARIRFSIKFYLVAMLFILFDIEAIFFYPWATVHRWLGVYGLIEMGIFVAILVVGYVYILKRGALTWE